MINIFWPLRHYELIPFCAIIDCWTTIFFGPDCWLMRCCFPYGGQAICHPFIKVFFVNSNWTCFEEHFPLAIGACLACNQAPISDVLPLLFRWSPAFLEIAVNCC